MKLKAFFVFLGSSLFYFSFAFGALSPKKMEMKDRGASVSLRWKDSQAWMTRQSSVNLQWSQEVIQNGDWILKSSLIGKVCKIKSNEAQEVLLQLLSDKALVVRSAAVDCLAQRMNPFVRESLWSAFQDPINKRGQQSLWIREQILEIFLAQPTASDRRAISQLKTVENEEKITELLRVMADHSAKSLTR